jgi:phosphoglucomutase
MNILEKAQIWTRAPFDLNTQKEIQNLLDQNDVEQLNDRFYKDLEFGTGGMRGIMGAGINRMNKYTYGKATQGLALYMKKRFPGKELQVAIGYDCRHNSDTFAKLVADVLSANGVKVYLFEEMRPTPELSFAVRYLKCDAGIVLTASHNPPEYNGYKVYWNDGGQIVPPEDTEIIAEVEALDFSEIKFTANENLIQYLGSEIDEAFWQASVSNGTFPATKGKKDLKIVFTSLHGTSIKLMPEALRRAGYTDVHIVEEQRIPNGDFPTVASPNPEEPAALKMALELAEKIGADIVLGTDPDSDRIGVAVRNNKGNMQLLNGNQTMCMMTEFLLKNWQAEGKLTGSEFVGSTIVSTDMMEKIAQHYGVEIKIGLTGFKWIAKMVREAEGKQTYIGGGEESFGYMVGDFNRDKDAITAALLACEIAADAKSKGSSMYNQLLEMYTRYGYYKEYLISMVRKGMDGAAVIKQMMVDLREKPLTEIAGEKVTCVSDYQSSIAKNLLNGESKPIDIPKSDVLIYHTENGTKISARPSGTEPKIKFYFSVNAPLKHVADVELVEKQLDTRIEKIIAELKLN